MDRKFENRYFCDWRVLAEFARKYSIGPTPRLTVLTGILALIALPMLFVAEEEKWFYWTMYAVLIGVQLFPNLYAWSVLKNMKAQNDGVLPQTVVAFSEENIQMFEGMVHLTIEYRKIEKAVRLKRSYALFNGKRTAVLIQPEGFTEGSFEAFKVFLAEKCPGIKIDE